MTRLHPRDNFLYSRLNSRRQPSTAGTDPREERLVQTGLQQAIDDPVQHHGGRGQSGQVQAYAVALVLQ